MGNLPALPLGFLTLVTKGQQAGSNYGAIFSERASNEKRSERRSG